MCIPGTSILILQNDDCSPITLKQLRKFIVEDCKDILDDTPIMLNCVDEEDRASVNCTQILADNESVEFYNY